MLKIIRIFLFRIRMRLLIISLCCLSCHENSIERKDGMVRIEGGTYQMGGDNDQSKPDELPKHRVDISAFWIDETEVTNAQFARFIAATGYVTTAEKDFEYTDEQGNIFRQKAGALVFHPLKKDEIENVGNWWKFVAGANWRHPQGPESSVEGKDNFPVVQISWQDAVAYAKWCGKRLPTEAEWEYAARGGLEDAVYPWGNRRLTNAQPMANIWNGDFPYTNTMQDGYLRTAPVRTFPPNAYGLYDMSGNVWEWCSDWYYENYYEFCANNDIFKHPVNSTINERGEKTIRGGSFLCNDSYCSGFRVAARMKTSPETGLEHTGFRCVRDVK